MSPLLKILLGVAQDSVLGALFLIMINDLAFIMTYCVNYLRKTLPWVIMTDKDLDTIINRFVKKLKVLLVLLETFACSYFKKFFWDIKYLKYPIKTITTYY
jgi:hypothetical protein